MADFSGLARGGRGLYISDVIHKAFVLIDEVGTEAAAATAVVMHAKSLPLEPEVVVAMKVDQPFLFFIRNTKTGDALFVGRVMNVVEKKA